MWPDEAIRERGSSTQATDQARYVNAAGWRQATVLIGSQGFNQGKLTVATSLHMDKSLRAWDVRGMHYVVEGVNG